MARNLEQVLLSVNVSMGFGVEPKWNHCRIGQPALPVIRAGPPLPQLRSSSGLTVGSISAEWYHKRLCA